MSDKIGCQIDGHPAHGVLFGHLIVSKIVINIYGGNGQARDFTIHVGRNHQQADTFPGSETGIDVTLGFGSLVYHTYKLALYTNLLYLILYETRPAEIYGKVWSH